MLLETIVILSLKLPKREVIGKEKGTLSQNTLQPLAFIPRKLVMVSCNVDLKQGRELSRGTWIG